jgi:amino acid adenylation domain-containing protein
MTPYLLHQLIERSAAEHPDRMAVIDGSRSLTYADLERQANRLAHLLIDLGLSPGDRVGLYLNKSLESVLGVYGVLKAGGAYVPLDPQAPPARIAYISADAGLRFLLSGKEKTRALGTLSAADPCLDAVILLNADTVETSPGVRVIASTVLADYPDTTPERAVVTLDLAYILYTSGSTGNPKGVMLSHLNALAFVQWASDCFAVQPEDRLSSHAPFHFDLSVFDLFASAHAGAAVVLVPRASTFPLELARFISERRISVWYSVPSALTGLVLHGGLTTGMFPELRAVLFAGEVFPLKYLRRLMRLLPHARFYNLYGPTETNVCTYYEVSRPPPSDQAAIPIGKPIRGLDVFAIANDGKVADPNEIGELCVRGPSVMQGYWNDPERTEHTLNAPLPADGLRTHAYRTGDLVRQDDNGNYWFLGRRDAQIKSRGYRIELGEIESTLLSHPAVIECAVLALPDEEITNRIAAFVALRSQLQESELARYCARYLPHYMIPEMFELMSDLPKTSTGKVDRQSLRAAAVQS